MATMILSINFFMGNILLVVIKMDMCNFGYILICDDGECPKEWAKIALC